MRQSSPWLSQDQNHASQQTVLGIGLKRPALRFLVVPMLILWSLFFILDGRVGITKVVPQQQREQTLALLELRQRHQPAPSSLVIPKLENEEEEEDHAPQLPFLLLKEGGGIQQIPSNLPLSVKIDRIEQLLMERATEALASLASSPTNNNISTINNPWHIDVQPRSEHDIRIKRTLNHNFILPPPRVSWRSSANDATTTTSHTSTAIVLVLSAEYQFTKRQAIRETWAKGHDNVYFVIGHSNCQDLNVNNTTTTTTTLTSAGDGIVPACRNIRHAFLHYEQQAFQDLLEVPMQEFYQGLPDKLIYSYQWTLQNVPQTVQWIIKVDDDMFARVSSLEHYLDRFNPHRAILIGKINDQSGVHKTGKWADLDYPHLRYPYWPQGSSGHVVSRATAAYLASHDTELFRYQGEDVSLGIWLQEAVDFPSPITATTTTTTTTYAAGDGGKEPWESPFWVTYIDARAFMTNQGAARCADPHQLIVGHALSVEDLQNCVRYADEGPREKAFTDQSARFIDHSRGRTKRGQPRRQRGR
jgi:Galactosyltransferase